MKLTKRKFYYAITISETYMNEPREIRVSIYNNIICIMCNDLAILIFNYTSNGNSVKID